MTKRHGTRMTRMERINADQTELSVGPRKKRIDASPPGSVCSGVGGETMNTINNGDDPQVDLVQRVCRHIEAHRDGPLTLTDLGRWAGSSPAHLQRVFRRVTGLSAWQHPAAARLDS